MQYPTDITASGDRKGQLNYWNISTFTHCIKIDIFIMLPAVDIPINVFSKTSLTA